MEESSSEQEEDNSNKEVLVNKLRNKYKGAHKGSDDLEKFLSRLQREILSVGWDNEIPII